jgi:hypothetical protein
MVASLLKKERTRGLIKKKLHKNFLGIMSLYRDLWGEKSCGKGRVGVGAIVQLERVILCITWRPTSSRKELRLDSAGS